MSAITQLMILSLVLNGAFQTRVISGKQAVIYAQSVLVSDLEPEMPARPLATWFKDIVGKGAGITWQLNECGKEIDPNLKLLDLPACVEAIALLPDNRKVSLMVEVGTFKKGVTGPPKFSFAIIEMQGVLHGICRLKDLIEGMRDPSRLEVRQSIAPTLPASLSLVSLPRVIVDWSPIGKRHENEIPPPPPRAQPTPAPEIRRVSEGVLRGSAIKKVQPLYPAGAKKSKASGKVEVQVAISETGRVVNASAISGHPLLRRSAVEAALQWTFAPTTLNGIPTSVQSTLTFVFTAP